MMKMAIVFVTAVGLLACSDPPFDPGAIADDFTTVNLLGVEFSGATTVSGDRVTSKVRLTNATDSVVGFYVYPQCPFDVSAHDNVERTAPASWNSAEAAPCVSNDQVQTLQPGQSVEVARSVHNILGDSLRERRYFFSAVVGLRLVYEGAAFATGVIRTGNAVVTR